MVIIGIVYGTFHIHKSKRCNSKPRFNAFMADFLMLNDSVKCPDNKESKYKIMLAEKLKLLANCHGTESSRSNCEWKQIVFIWQLQNTVEVQISSAVQVQ